MEALEAPGASVQSYEVVLKLMQCIAAHLNSSAEISCSKFIIRYLFKDGRLFGYMIKVAVSGSLNKPESNVPAEDRMDSSLSSSIHTSP